METFDIAAALLAAPVLYCLYRMLVPTPPPSGPRTMQLGPSGASASQRAIACGTGGYDALTAVELGPTGAVRGTAVSFEGVTDANVVTVSVEAAGVNYADVCLRWGLYVHLCQCGKKRPPPPCRSHTGHTRSYSLRPPPPPSATRLLSLRDNSGLVQKDRQGCPWQRVPVRVKLNLK